MTAHDEPEGLRNMFADVAYGPRPPLPAASLEPVRAQAHTPPPLPTAAELSGLFAGSSRMSTFEESSAGRAALFQRSDGSGEGPSTATAPPAPLTDVADPDSLFGLFPVPNSDNERHVPAPSAPTPEVTLPDVEARGIRRALARVGIRVPPSRADIDRAVKRDRARADETEVRQATWSRTAAVLIGNEKGGSGKTPLTLSLGGTLAHIRGGSVALVETSDGPGSLLARAEGTPSAGIAELEKSVHNIRTGGQLSQYSAPQSSFAHVFGSLGPRGVLDGIAVRNICAVVDQFYVMRVMDSGNRASSEAFIAAAEQADIFVLPVMNSSDSLLAGLSTLQQLRQLGAHGQQLADNVIIVRLSDGRPETVSAVEQVAAAIAQIPHSAVFSLPFDAHLAERGEISLEKLSTETRAALLQIAASTTRTLSAVLR